MLQRFAFILAALASTAVAAPPSYTVVELHPAGFDDSAAQGITADGTQQVGDMSTGVFLTNFDGTAVLWSGSAASAVDLTPPVPMGFDETLGIYGSSVGGGNQAGFAFLPDFTTHAVVWSGTGASAIDIHSAAAGADSTEAVYVDADVAAGTSYFFSSVEATAWDLSPLTATSLHPVSGYNNTTVLGSDGTRFVGTGQIPLPQTHAMLWTSASNAAFVDLHPASGWDSTRAEGVDGANSQCGRGTPTGFSTHAVVWSGTAASIVDMHPAGYTASAAIAVRNGRQIGFATTGGQNHAMVWQGSAASAVDLHPALGAGYTASEATDVSNDGKITGFAVTTGGNTRAVMWVPPSNVADWQLF